jgi:hypothetical protein
LTSSACLRQVRPLFPKLTDQLLLLCINTDHGPSSADKALFLASDILELLISFRAPKPALLPLIGFQGEVHILEQAGNRVGTGSMTLIHKLLAQLAQATANPLLLGHGVTRYLVCDKPLQCRDNGWICFFYQLASSTESTNSVSFRDVRSGDGDGCGSRVRAFRIFQSISGSLHNFGRSRSR